MTLAKWGRTSPFGFLRYAEEYRVAAETLYAANAAFTAPQYLLIGQSLELSLKAYIRSRGEPIENFGHQSKGLGHDLSVLLDGANRRRLARIVQLSTDEECAIRELSESYAQHLFRYIKTGSMSLPSWDMLSLTARHLTKGLWPHCLRVTIGAAASKGSNAERSCRTDG